ncbi:hypothetical protein H310_05472 [Aphanomyces invadans]|uniref:Tudor domain-containing protein n=1 Tax=Aphanomyces invadans TaxID=157072 RepID=A0A024U9E6_9STRA|nr:hypothetical protein H310_05472 [Aphanomyces invadans]ETW03041.1 hypothetical protein H310_05472 [Aphanomyces invadans]|eukprot:XP_008868425.1 hypothetical protein H310_05472 [Aphanomyces invadans]
MSDYNESFDEFVEDEVESDGAVQRRQSRSPRRTTKPPGVEPLEESSYDDESFEAASLSPAKERMAHAATTSPPLAKFPCGLAVEVHWPDEGEWFAGNVVEYDPTRGYFVRYVDGDEQWEDDKYMRWPQKPILEPSPDPTPPPPTLSDGPTLLPPPELKRIVIPRAYTPQAHHPSNIKTARPYTCVASHPVESSMYLTPRRFKQAMEACSECRARCNCVHESVRWARSSSPSPSSVHGQHPLDHRFLQPVAAEKETQTYACSAASQHA